LYSGDLSAARGLPSDASMGIATNWCQKEFDIYEFPSVNISSLKLKLSLHMRIFMI